MSATEATGRDFVVHLENSTYGEARHDTMMAVDDPVYDTLHKVACDDVYFVLREHCFCAALAIRELAPQVYF